SRSRRNRSRVLLHPNRHLLNKKLQSLARRAPDQLVEALVQADEARRLVLEPQASASTLRLAVEATRPQRARLRQPASAGEADAGHEDREQADAELPLRERDERKRDVSDDQRGGDESGSAAAVVNAERGEPGEKKSGEQHAEHRGVNRTVAFLTP